MIRLWPWPLNVLTLLEIIVSQQRCVQVSRTESLVREGIEVLENRQII